MPGTATTTSRISPHSANATGGDNRALEKAGKWFCGDVSPELPGPFSNFGRAKSVLLILARSLIIFETLQNACCAMVQRLAHRPFKAVIRVRFPLALPSPLFASFSSKNGVLV